MTMPTAPTFCHDPQAVLPYAIDWTTWLTDENTGGGTDTITSATWSADPVGLTLEDDSLAGAKATVWISGGAQDSFYRVTCHIVTSAGREDDRTIRVLVTNR